MDALETALTWAGLVTVASIPVAVVAWLFRCIFLTIRDCLIDTRWMLRFIREREQFKEWLKQHEYGDPTEDGVRIPLTRERFSLRGFFIWLRREQ